MRVRLKLELDCSPERAWELLRSPEGFRAAVAPLLRVRSLEPGGFPERWAPGEHRIAVRLLGLVPLGEQRVDLDFSQHRGARILTDDGAPLSGALALVTRWQHRMAVAPSRRGSGTLYLDRLDFGAGALGVLLWPGLWLLWQYRAGRLRALARG